MAPSGRDMVASKIRERIAAGEWAPGPLPSAKTLGAEYDVGEAVARGALAVLRQEGLVRAQQGGRHYVQAPRRRILRDATKRYTEEKKLVRLSEAERRRDGSMERDTGVPIGEADFHCEIDTVPADPDLAREFGVDAGTPLLRRRYWQAPQHEALTHESCSYLIHTRAAENPALLDAAMEPWPGGTQHQLWTLGIEVARIVETLGARQATADEAKRFGLDRGVPVIAIRKVSIATTGDVVEVADIVSPGDRTVCSYTVDLPKFEDA